MVKKSSAGLLTFSELFSRSFNFLKAHITPVAIIAIFSGIVSSVMLIPLYMIPQVINPTSGQVAPDFGGNPEVLGIFILCASIGGIVSTILSMGYWSIAIEGKDDIGYILKRALKITLPMIGISLWTFLRSFAWLVVLGLLIAYLGGFGGNSMALLVGVLLVIMGIAFAAVYGPRFIAAPVIYLTEKKGITESVQLSYVRTKGHWGKVVGNILLLALCGWLIGIVISFVANFVEDAGLGVVGSAGIALAVIGILISAAVQSLLGAFGTFFITNLSVTVMENPKKA